MKNEEELIENPEENFDVKIEEEDLSFDSISSELPERLKKKKHKLSLQDDNISVGGVTIKNEPKLIAEAIKHLISQDKEE